jgi:hypothetical protein
MRGLTIRLTNVTASVLALADLPGQPVLAVGETRELLYTSEVQVSLEYGSINGYLVSGRVTAQFVSGTTLNQAPVGRTYVGATPTSEGGRGLVPPAAIADRGGYLKADGTWEGITPAAIGAIPQSVLTAQGDTLYRGITTVERLPLGSVGQVYRAGVVHPEWADAAKSGLLVSRPLPGPTLAGVLYWATDQPIGSQLSICYFDGSGYAWLNLGTGGGGGGNTNTTVVEFDYNDTSPLVVGVVTAGMHLDRALVSVTGAWNGAAPTVTFGTVSSPFLLLTSLDVDLTSVGQYESGELHTFASGGNLILTITPNGSTSGTGTLLFTLVS